jgi:hypothetical protein
MSIERQNSSARQTSKVFQQKAAQHSVHPTDGSLRVFWHVSGLKLVPSKRRSLVPPTRG